MVVVCPHKFSYLKKLIPCHMANLRNILVFMEVPMRLPLGTYKPNARHMVTATSSRLIAILRVTCMHEMCVCVCERERELGIEISGSHIDN